MAGNQVGGKKAAAKNKALHGPDFYARIGAIGGRKGTTGGFYANRELAREAGRRGGLVSRRTKVANAATDNYAGSKTANAASTKYGSVKSKKVAAPVADES